MLSTSYNIPRLEMSRLLRARSAKARDAFGAGARVAPVHLLAGRWTLGRPGVQPVEAYNHPEVDTICATYIYI